VSGAVVSGRGVVTALGETADAFFDALLEGRSGIADGVSACADFDPEAWMEPRDARRADRFTQFGVAAALQAADEAAIADCDPERVAVLIGTGVGGLTTLQEQCQAYFEGGERAVSPNFVPMMMPNAAAAVVAMRLGLRGPGYSLASACATGAHAIGVGIWVLLRVV
jgi:3-oxoacyl-[acyl-carrier-protein] synthase II